MPGFRIAVIGGDGIGPEVIEQAIRVADVALGQEPGVRIDWHRLPWSGAWYQQTGQMMPSDGWEILRQHDAILLGAIGHPAVAAAAAPLATSPAQPVAEGRARASTRPLRAARA